MPVPDFQSLMLLVLKAFAGGGEPPLSQVRERIAAAEGLSAEELREILPSGRQSVFVNRVGWAVIYMERDRAERVKRETPILVILGNPPYNGFAGMAVDEERELSEAYRTTKRVRRPEGQGLNDLYVRFFRMAERRIAEKTGRGVVCFISNYSWLDGLSFTGMRERLLKEFDAIRIDCLNGDKYKTGNVAPDGTPDPSIFSTEGDPVGIQVGTAITTPIRKAEHRPAEAEPDALYEGIEPVLPLGLPFVRTAVSDEWFGWPSLPDLFLVSFPGVKTSRDGFLVDVDLDRLRERVCDYFDAGLSHEEIARSAERGRELVALLDPDIPVPGVTRALLRPEVAAIVIPSTIDGRNMTIEDLAVTAGWGHFGQGDAVMPGQGRIVERALSADERAAMSETFPALGERTFDIYLNGEAFWRNISAAVWNYRLGGYQVLKKWLSYQERTVLGRAQLDDEIQRFMDTARRIVAILLLTGAGFGQPGTVGS